MTRAGALNSASGLRNGFCPETQFEITEKRDGGNKGRTLSATASDTHTTWVVNRTHQRAIRRAMNFSGSRDQL